MHLSDSVMKITTSLYSEQRAANLWYNKIRKALVDELVFKVSDFDPCLFICKDCLLCLYVNDAILHACKDKMLNEVLNTIAQCSYGFDCDEDFNSYLGVQVDHNPDGSKTLLQPGLARQLLDMRGMQDCNPSRTPMSNPLFPHATSDDGSRQEMVSSKRL
eukprot:scaffold7139_cov100-Amphora_coffeaeformis.AAC.3